jgi:Bacterial Ig-like domain (group 3)/Beta-propeller repeat/Putative Ig domain
MKRALTLAVALLAVPVLVRPLAAQAPAPKGAAPPGSVSQDSGKPKNPRPAEAYGRLPLSFEANDGQTDRRVKFLSHSSGQTLFLTSTEAVLTPSSGNSVRMKLVGANRHATVRGLDPLPGRSNYFLGRDQANWRTNVSTFAKVRYGQIYPGIDLVYYGNQRQLEYDFVVASGADPAQIRLSIRGASELSIDADGNAVARRKDGDVRLLKPRLYQEVRGERVEIAGGYALNGNELRFAVGQYDHRQKLVIDPVLVYSTYLGGINSDGASGVAVDSAGNTYVVGITSFTGFPVTPGVFQPTGHGSTNAFVAKLNAAGTALVYSTYIGGSGQDTAYAIAVDASGNAYITGTTISPDFPTTVGAFQTLLSAAPDAFVTKLGPDGSALVYSTYLGGNANDIAFAIAVDASGNAYVVGETQSGNFPVLGSSPKVLGGPITCDSLISGGFDGFITKFNPAGDTVAYSLYLGGSGTDVATSVAVDSAGNAYVAGYTTSKDFLVLNTCPGPGPGPTSLQPANAGTENGFIVKVSPDALAFLGATYLGGSAQEAVTSIAVDGSGFVYLAGEGNSGGAGGLDAFGAKLDGSLSSKVYFNYIGGSGFDRATGVAVDPAGNEYLVGQTASTNFPQVSPIQPAFGGGTYDAFVTELDPSGTTVFSTYLGGTGDESTSIGGSPIAIDASGNIYVVGSTTSTNFPGASSSSIQPANGGGNDAFIVKLGPSSGASITSLVTSGNPSAFGQQVSLTVTVSPNSPSSNTPSGTVTINDGSTTLGTVTLASGTAIFNTSTLAVGNHSITASYAGDANFSASISTPVSQVVNQGTTTTSLSASPNPATLGQSVTLSATVTPVAPAAGMPTGTVTFLDGATSLGTGTLSGGQATLATSSLASGAHSITVRYAGDPNFAGNTSSAVSVAIQQATTTALIVAPNPANAGQLVTLSATVAATSGGPTGETVTFLDGAAVLGTGTISAGGTATFTTASLAVGGHNLSASYAGDANFAPSTSGTVPLTVALPPVVITDNETVTVTDTESFPDVSDAETVHVTDQVSIQAISPTTTSISAPGVAFGTPAAAAVSVTSAFAAVSGNVMLSVDGGAATTLPLSSGSAVFGLGLLATGTHSLSASFPAQGNFFASSATGSIFVGQAPSITSGSATTFVAGTAGSFTVTTTGVPFPALAITSGTLPTGVTFVDNGNGTATLARTPPPGATGVFPLTITASNGVGVPAVQSFTLTVNQPPSIISGNIATFTEGAPGSFTVTVAGFPIPAISESPALPAGLTLVDNGDGTASLSGTPATGTQGSYAITIAATNGVSPDASQSFTLNINLGPAITSGSSTTFTEQMADSFLVTTLAFPAPVLTETGALPSGVTFTDNHDGTATLAGTPAVGTSNSYPITVSASNGVGAPTVQAFTLTVNATASISSGSTTTFTVGSVGFFSVTTSGSPVPALTFTGTLPAGVTFTDNGNGTATLTGTPAAGTANSYPIIITATNGVGSPAIQNFTLVVNQGAAILTGNATTFTVGVSTSFTVMTSGFPTPSIVEAPPLPLGVTFVDNGDGTGTLSGIPAVNTGGTYPITFTANNGVDLPALQAFTLTINQGPAITSSNMVTLTEQTFGFFTVTASGNPVPALSEVGALPNGLSFVDEGNGTALISGGLAAGSSGQYGFTITAANGVLPNATQTFTLTVVPLVGITSANSATFTVGTSGSFLVTTTGIPIPTLTIAGALPSGVAFTPNSDGTATLSGIPAAGTEGVYPVTLTAKNSAATSTQSFTLSVVLSTTPGTPTINSANHTTFWKGVQNRFTVTTTGFPVPALTVPPANIPAGVTFQDNHDGTATVSGFPTFGIGSFAFTITATGAGGKQFAVAQRFTLRAGLLPPVPKFTSASQTVFQVGVYSSFTVAAGPVITSITRQGPGLPAGVTYTDNHDGTATLSGTPQDPTGAIGSSGLLLQYAFTASSNAGANYSTTQTFTLLVLPAASSAPAFTSANHTSFWRGQQNRFTVTTTGFPIPVLTVPPAKVPAGVTFQDNHDGTATISGFPVFFGPFGFTITATGAGGKQFAAVQRFTAGAGNVPRVPKFTSASQTVFQVGVYSSFTVAAGPVITSITRQGPGLPAGVTYTDNHDGTATLSGTPQDPTGAIGSSGLLLQFTLTASNPQVSSIYQITQTFTLLVLP